MRTRLVAMWMTSLVMVAVSAGCAGPGNSPARTGGGIEAHERHMRATERIEQLGGRVTEARRGPIVTLYRTDSRALREALREVRNLAHVDSVALIPSEAVDPRLREMGELPSLRDLLVRGAPLSARDVRYIDTGLPALRTLTLIHTGATDERVAALGVVDQLVELTLVESRITDRTARRLEGMPELRRLRLTGTRVTADAARRLVRENPQMVVDLDGRRFRGRYAAE